jgi:hypothetical protein
MIILKSGNCCATASTTVAASQLRIKPLPQEYLICKRRNNIRPKRVIEAIGVFQTSNEGM